ncbi:MAG: tRNA(Met) cytidine acetyltransferase TmcA [Halovenus sp.]
MDAISRLLAEARSTNERRLVVLTGPAETTRRRIEDLLSATDIDPGATSYVGPEDAFHCESLSHHEADRLLGTSREAVVYDCHERCEPTSLGQIVGTVVGGGLVVLLTPPLSAWPDSRDEFDRSLAVPPFDLSEVGTAFRRRLIETLRTHRGIAVIDAETGTVEQDGRCHPAPRLPKQPPTAPADHRFPDAAYDACKTGDQVEAVRAFERLRDDDEAVVVEADRGRGKSSAAGLAAASLASAGQDVLVTAPSSGSIAALFDRASELLEAIETPFEQRDDRTVETERGRIRYEAPTEAATLPDDPDTVFVDEAAAIPVRLLGDLLAARSIAFTTTVRGYEGTGRGFSVRFRGALAESRFTVTELSLSEPIRYAAGDPVEVWLFRALALDASPPVDAVVEDAAPDTVEYRQMSSAELLADPHLLRELFGLLVTAHYRTEPNDLARLLDAPNVSIHALTSDDHVVAVALLAREGSLPETLRTAIYEGQRVQGNLIPDVLTSQLRDENAGKPDGCRVMRIATHPARRSQGLGSHLLDRIGADAKEQGVDWLGVAYGVTPELVEFWMQNGYRTVHLSTTRNDRSGEHSVVMLRPLSDQGKQLHHRHTEWFLRRTPETLRESLSTVEPAVVRAACRSTSGDPALDLTKWEWRHAAGLPHGKAIFETAPRAVRKLCFRYLVDDADLLSPEQERLLIRKALQGQPWATVTEMEGFQTESICKRTLGSAVEPLVERYGTAAAVAELERYR